MESCPYGFLRTLREPIPWINAGRFVPQTAHLAARCTASFVVRALRTDMIGISSVNACLSSGRWRRSTAESRLLSVLRSVDIQRDQSNTLVWLGYIDIRGQRHAVAEPLLTETYPASFSPRAIRQGLHFYDGTKSTGNKLHSSSQQKYVFLNVLSLPNTCTVSKIRLNHILSATFMAGCHKVQHRNPLPPNNLTQNFCKTCTF